VGREFPPNPSKPRPRRQARGNMPRRPRREIHPAVFAAISAAAARAFLRGVFFRGGYCRAWLRFRKSVS
ncbi:MAG: hypothetical protein MPL62_17885, partial [Alphaproteobacteria bacterium]|nr:hypothetical protein [Alphaproteobacteria bacterium]